MRLPSLRVTVVCLALVFGVALVPATSFGLGQDPLGTGSDDSSAVSPAAAKAHFAGATDFLGKRKKSRCRRVRRGGRKTVAAFGADARRGKKKRVCKKPPVTVPTTPAAPGLPGIPYGNDGLPGNDPAKPGTPGPQDPGPADPGPTGSRSRPPRSFDPPPARRSTPSQSPSWRSSI